MVWAYSAGRRGRERGGGEADSPEDLGKETSGQSSFGKKAVRGVRVNTSCHPRKMILLLLLL